MSRYSNPKLVIARLQAGTTLETIEDAPLFSLSGTQLLNRIGRGSFRVHARSAGIAELLREHAGELAIVTVTDAVAGGATMDVATFIIENVKTDVEDPGGPWITVSGNDHLNQLTYRSANDNVIDNGSGARATDDIDKIMAFAPVLWSATASGSSGGSYHQARGDHVFKLLKMTADRNGDLFRITTYNTANKELTWLSAPDSSGVTLRMPTEAGQYEGSTTVGILLSFSEEQDWDPFFNRIFPYGAGLGEGRLDLTGITATDTGGDPTGYETDFVNNWIRNNDSVDVSGVGYTKEIIKDFPYIRAADPENEDEAKTAAVELWREALSLLQQHASSRKFYRATCNVAANLRPGQTIDIVYDEYEGGISGGDKVIEVSETLVILEVTNSFENGVRITNLVLGDEPRPQPSGEDFITKTTETLQDVERKVDAGANSTGFVRKSLVLQAAAPVRIDGGDSANLSGSRTWSLGSLDSFGAANQVIGINSGATDAEYKTIAPGTNVTINHTAGAITINSTTFAPLGAGYVVMALSDDLPNERLATAGDGISITDQGFGGGNLTWAARLDANGGLEFNSSQIRVKLPTNHGLSRSSAGLALGTPSTITAATSNAVTTTTHSHELNISPGDIGAALNSNHYLTLALSANLTNERVFAPGNGLTASDGGANGNYTVTLGTPGSLTASSTNNVTTSSHTHAIDSTIARSAITISAGNGLTGGGDLTANRTITLGTPGSLTASSTNNVTTSSHTHSIDSTIARSAITITGTGALGGGGDLTANRTITMNTPGSLTASSTNSAGTNHTHAIDSTIARSAITISAGNGLTGGGDLTTNRTLTLGTPGTLTASSSNAVTASSHTHAITTTANGAASTIIQTDSSGYVRLGGGSGTAQRRLHVVGNNGVVASFPSAAMTGTESLILENAGANSSMAIISAANAFSSLKFIESGASAMGGHIFYKHDTGTMVFSAGSGIERMYLTEGLRVGLPTSGGDPGQGWINVLNGIQRNGTNYTNPDYALERHFYGRIERFKDNPGAERYAGLVPLENLESYLKENLHLPGRWETPNLFDWADMAQMWSEELAIYITQLHKRIKNLEEKLA